MVKTKQEKKEYDFNRNRMIRLECLHQYTHKEFIECKMCGYDDNYNAFVLHHRLHNGKEHRKLLNCHSGIPFYKKLRKLEYPHDIKFPLDILCCNCHQIITTNQKRLNL